MKRIRIIPTKDGDDQSPVEAEVLSENANGFEFELPLGISQGLGIKHFVERVGIGRVEIEPTELGYRAEGHTPIYRYRATYVL